MRLLFLFLFLMLPIFAAYTGETTVQVEKTWTIFSNHTIPELTLNGTFLMDNNFQQAYQLNVTDGAKFEVTNGHIRVIFSTTDFIGERKITATALVTSDYPPSIKENPPFEAQESLECEGLLSYDDSMASLAASLAAGKETQLEVLSSLVDWTHEYIDYDLAHLGEPAPALEVFQLRSGVCVGYVHLFISLARSLGFETRFVSGYAFSDEWEDHAWAEVKVGDVWVPADPTFREFGVLDARHIAISYSEDRGARDILVSRGANLSTRGLTFNSTVDMRTLEKLEFPETLFVHTVLHEDDLQVVVYNPTEFYITPTYSFSVPEYLHPGDKTIFVISPSESKYINYHLNTDELDTGYTHTLPYRIELQGTVLNDELVIVKGGQEPTNGNGQDQPTTVEDCPLITGAVMLLLAGMFASSLREN